MKPRIALAQSYFTYVLAITYLILQQRRLSTENVDIDIGPTQALFSPLRSSSATPSVEPRILGSSICYLVPYESRSFLHIPSFSTSHTCTYRQHTLRSNPVSPSPSQQGAALPRIGPASALVRPTPSMRPDSRNSTVVLPSRSGKVG